MTYEVFLPLVTVSGVLAGVGATYHQCEYMPLVGAKWYYDWSLTPPNCQGVETVPMIYGERHIGKLLGGNSGWVLWFNEPENDKQANLTPERAAELWNADIERYAFKKHVSPAVYDLSWLSKFLGLVNRKPDALAVHLYAWESLDTALTRARQFLERSVSLAQAHGIQEVWLTEWASLPGYMGMDYALEYERKMLSEILPSFPQITRQAWFQLNFVGGEQWWPFGMDNNTSLVGGTGQITQFGRVYRDTVVSWDHRADVNKNGKVDILDISIVAGQYGRHD